jgi:mono/diheme cytochrome c family protein
VFRAVRSRTQRLAALATAAALTAVFASGCGGDDPSMSHGKELFAAKCASCHTLKRAGSKGVTGPNLDEAFGPARAQGLGQTTIEGVVLDQISNVRRNSQMPPDLVKGDDANDVAAYVAFVAGQSGKDEGRLASAGQPKTSSKPIVAKAGKLQIDAVASGATAFLSTEATAGPGPLRILSVNPSATPHNIAIKEAGGKLVEGKVVSNGGTSELSANLKAGEYEFLCTVPGHADSGMKGTLTVQ